MAVRYHTNKWMLINEELWKLQLQAPNIYFLHILNKPQSGNNNDSNTRTMKYKNFHHRNV